MKIKKYLFKLLKQQGQSLIQKILIHKQIYKNKIYFLIKIKKVARLLIIIKNKIVKKNK